MKLKLVRPIVAILGLALISAAPVANEAPEENGKVILVDLDVKSPTDASKCFTSQFDRKRVELSVDIDDPLNTLEDYKMFEEPLEGPDCFMPEIKVIFRTSTYVFSLYCTSVVRYRNSAPYKPSSKKVSSDIKVTESVLDYLEEARKKHFGSRFDPRIAAKFVKREKMAALDTKVDDKLLYEEEEEDDDKELEKDAHDKEGWFDDKDPTLDTDETPDEEDEDH